MFRRLFLMTLAVAFGLPCFAAPNVTRTTLKNGLRVIVVSDPLAPVVTVYDNYLVGANETPRGFPGMAHAQEHMLFRGCTGMTADQTAAIYAQLGGDNDADTTQNVTQYFATVPAQDVDVALHADSACMAGVVDSQAEWAQERGAIEQEVARDLSDPTYKLITRLNHDLFTGTPYEFDALGTKASFDKTTGQMLHTFYDRWYTPNNAILVIAGNVDPEKTIALVKELYENIPSHPLPARPKVNLQAIRAENFVLPSDYPYVITTVAYRMPGTDSPDYAASRILADVLASQRAEIYGLVPEGKALDAGFALVEKYPKASMALAYAALPATAGAEGIDAALRNIMVTTAQKGVSPELFEAAKQSEIATAEFERNSIPGLAARWSEAVAAEGRTSPEEDVDAIKKVTLADVNRVAREYLVDKNAVVGTLKPEKSGEAVASKGFGGAEKVTSAPTKPVVLPAWAQQELSKLEVPSWNLNPADMTLKNGIRLIVQTDTTTPTVTIAGEVKGQPDLEAPQGQNGVDTVLGSLFSYGTTTLDRLQFQKALDDIAATESAGSTFSLQVLKKNFERGTQLLADNELHPALPAPAFKIVQQETAETVAGTLESPGFRSDLAMLKGLLPKDDPELRYATPESVNSLTLQDVDNYYKKTFRPDLTTIVVIGDVSPEEARVTIEKYFGEWQATGPKPETDYPAVPQNKPSASVVPDPTSVDDAVTRSEELEMNRFNPDYYPLQVGDHVLGGGFYATRLYRDLRQQTGYVYYVSDTLDAGKTRTRYSISYGADPANVAKANALITRDLTEMQTTNVAEGELELAKALLLRQIPLEEASETNVAQGLLARAVIGLPLDEPLRAAKKYDATTADEVRVAFAKWIRPNDFVEVVRGPQPH